MKQNETKKASEYDVPIPKPNDDFLDKFLRATEARFITKRFPKRNDTHQNRFLKRRPEAQ